jgi:hypothetical protein
MLAEQMHIIQIATLYLAYAVVRGLRREGLIFLTTKARGHKVTSFKICVFVALGLCGYPACFFYRGKYTIFKWTLFH